MSKTTLVVAESGVSQARRRGCCCCRRPLAGRRSLAGRWIATRIRRQKLRLLPPPAVRRGFGFTRLQVARVWPTWFRCTWFRVQSGLIFGALIEFANCTVATGCSVERRWKRHGRSQKPYENEIRGVRHAPACYLAPKDAQRRADGHGRQTGPVGPSFAFFFVPIIDTKHSPTPPRLERSQIAQMGTGGEFEVGAVLVFAAASTHCCPLYGPNVQHVPFVCLLLNRLYWLVKFPQWNQNRKAQSGRSATGRERKEKNKQPNGRKWPLFNSVWSGTSETGHPHEHDPWGRWPILGHVRHGLRGNVGISERFERLKRRS